MSSIKTGDLLQPQQLHDYQKECVLHALYHDDVMLWLQVGLGKTIITLTTIVDRMRAGQVSKTLIFGPLRVVNSVWHTEIQKWSHTKGLKCSIVTGSPRERERKLWYVDADIYLINYENMNWIAEQLERGETQNGRFKFDMVVYDEVSMLKDSTSVRMGGAILDEKKNGKITGRKIRKIAWRRLLNKFKYRMGLTGTPSSNGYLDLHGQFLAVDGGQRLGAYKTHYQQAYFAKAWDGWGYEVTDAGRQFIEYKISDITKKMDAADYLTMPPVTEVDVMVDLPAKAMKAYKELEKKLFTALDSGTEVELFNKTSLSIKTLQICNGGIYITDEMGEKLGYEELHKAKLDALAEIMEELAGQPALCSYSFIPDAERIEKRFGKKYRVVNLTQAPANQTSKIIEDWQAGKIDLLLAHPKSAGHGIDGLQKAGSVVIWYGCNWSLELYEQLNGRIARQGQSKPVSIIRLLAQDTIDIAVADALKHKASTQAGLKAAIDRLRGKPSPDFW